VVAGELPAFNGSAVIDIIYLLTAIGLSPGGSSNLEGYNRLRMCEATLKGINHHE